MTQENGSWKFAPECYREYLRLLARVQLPRRLHGQLSASDMAQETILKAHNKREQFRGATEAEYRAWLRRMLACPPSVGYRLAKFARRNRAALTTVILVASALLTTVVALVISNISIRQEEKKKIGGPRR